MKFELPKFLSEPLTDKEGKQSARKWAAFTIIIMVVVLHIKWFKSTQWQYIVYVLGLDFLFILICLGLATVQNIIEFKNGKNDTIAKQPE